jgi:hypothetical protein
LFCSSIIFLFLCVKYIVLSLYLILSNRVVLIALNIRATNYFANLFINICCFNSIFLANNKEINVNKTTIYLRKIIFFAIEEDIFAFKSYFFFLLCLISYNLLIINKQIKNFNKIKNLKIFNNICNVSLVPKTYINYLEFALYIRINCLAKQF